MIPTKHGLTRVSGHQVSLLGNHESQNLKIADVTRSSPGNAWAALGMSRVAATIKKSPFANEMTSQINDLNAWTKEILDGVFAALVSSYSDVILKAVHDNNHDKIVIELRQPCP